MVQTVLSSAQRTADVGNHIDGVLDHVQRLLGAALRADVQGGQAQSLDVSVIDGDLQVVVVVAGVADLQVQSAAALGHASIVINGNTIFGGSHYQCIKILEGSTIIAVGVLVIGVLHAVDVDIIAFGISTIQVRCRIRTASRIATTKCCRRNSLTVLGGQIQRDALDVGLAGLTVGRDSAAFLGLKLDLATINADIEQAAQLAVAVQGAHKVVDADVLSGGEVGDIHLHGLDIAVAVQIADHQAAGAAAYSSRFSIGVGLGILLSICNRYRVAALQAADVVGGELEGLGHGAGGHGAVQQLDAVEVGGVGDTVDLGLELLHFLLHLSTVGLVVEGAVGGLLSQGVHTVEHVVDLGQSTLSGPHQGDTVLGVLLSALQTGDLGTHLLRNSQTSGVVTGAVDLVTGRQLLQVLGESGVIGVVVAVGVHSHNVVLDTHLDSLLINLRITGAFLRSGSSYGARSVMAAVRTTGITERAVLFQPARRPNEIMGCARGNLPSLLISADFQKTLGYFEKNFF